MLTYQKATEMVNGRRDRGGRGYGFKIENNTWLEGALGCEAFAVRLHGTYIVTIYPNGTYRLDSGGHRTVTTKDRLNKYGPVKVFQRRNEWFVQVWPEFGETLVTWFFDGVLVSISGRLINHHAAEVAGLDPDTPREIVKDWFEERGLPIPPPK